MRLLRFHFSHSLFDPLLRRHSQCPATCHSTLGPSPALIAKAGRLPCGLAWSVHVADDALRKQLVPTTSHTMLALRYAFIATLRRRRPRHRRPRRRRRPSPRAATRRRRPSRPSSPSRSARSCVCRLYVCRRACRGARAGGRRADGAAQRPRVLCPIVLYTVIQTISPDNSNIHPRSLAVPTCTRAPGPGGGRRGTRLRPRAPVPGPGHRGVPGLRERICRRRGELLCAPGGAASPGLPRAAKSHQFVPLHARGTGHWTAAQRAVPRRHPPADPARPRPRAHAHAQRDRVYAAADRSARRRGWSGLRTRVRPNAARVARALATPHQHALQRLQPQQNS